MSSGLISPQKLLHSRERFLILLCLITGLLVLVPILNRFLTAQMFLDIFLTAIAMITGILFISVVIASILGFMFKSEMINREINYQAILLYLLAAL